MSVAFDTSASVLATRFLALGDIFSLPPAFAVPVATASATAGASSFFSSFVVSAVAVDPSSFFGTRAEISSPSAPIMQTVSRQGTSSPSSAKTLRSVPSTVAASSKADLSVS